MAVKKLSSLCRKLIYRQWHSFISKGLLGRFYIAGAKIKGIKKYCYSKNKIKEIILKTGLELEKSVSVKRMGFELGKIMFLIKPKGF